MADDQGKPPRLSHAVAPRRALNSMRRTSNVDVSWPTGRGGELVISGSARDLYTSPEGQAQTLGVARLEARLAPDKTLLAIETSPHLSVLQDLIGMRAGGGLRKALFERVSSDRLQGAPLYQLLDDISAASLVSGWAWSQWSPNWLVKASAGVDVEAVMRSREGICAGFSPGSSGFSLETDRSGTPASDLVAEEDPDGGHKMPLQQGVGFRRARRIDVRVAEGIEIEALFQDSATTPIGGRAVVHEYALHAFADPQDRCVQSISAEPHVLPFVECRAAAENLSLLVGAPLNSLQNNAGLLLRGVVGCTHLTDAARALADVPTLLSHIKR